MGENLVESLFSVFKTLLFERGTENMYEGNPECRVELAYNGRLYNGYRL